MTTVTDLFFPMQSRECPKRLVITCNYIELSIITQLIEVLKVMNAASVVHCNLKPSSIIVSNDKKIKLMNFTYSVNISKKKNL